MNMRDYRLSVVALSLIAAPTKVTYDMCRQEFKYVASRATASTLTQR